MKMDSRLHDRYSPERGRYDVERRLAAILTADVVGYTRLMGADEAGTLHETLGVALIDGAAAHAGIESVLV